MADKVTVSTVSGSQDPLEAMISQGLSGASAQANMPGRFFQNNPLNNYPVYLGAAIAPIGVVPKTGVLGGAGRLAAGVSGSQLGYTDYQSAVLAPTQWDANKMKDFINRGIINKVPGFEPGMGLPQVQAAWQNLVDSSIMFNQNLKPGQKPWSPDDVLNTWANQKGKFGTQRQGDWVYDVATGERIQYVGPRTKTTKSSQVDLSSPEDAQILITQTLQQALGRAPTAKELAMFRSTIAGYEKAHPQVTTTTTTLSDEDIARAQAAGTDVWAQASQQQSETSGGVSDAARAAQVLVPTQQTKEYGKYQSGTTYFNALLSLLGGGG